MPHRTDLSYLTVKQLDRRQQPITCQRHDAEIGKNIREIAPLRCEQEHSHNKTTESKRFYNIPSAVGKDGQPCIHPRYYRGMICKPAEEMFFRAMHLHRFDCAKHLLRFPELTAEMRFQILIHLSTFAREKLKRDCIKSAQNHRRRNCDHRLHEK